MCWEILRESMTSDMCVSFVFENIVLSSHYALLRFIYIFSHWFVVFNILKRMRTLNKRAKAWLQDNIKAAKDGKSLFLLFFEKFNFFIRWLGCIDQLSYASIWPDTRKYRKQNWKNVTDIRQHQRSRWTTTLRIFRSNHDLRRTTGKPTWAQRQEKRCQKRLSSK